MQIINAIANEIKPQLNKGKTLVYFASGISIKPEYRTLPYDNVLLVDKNFRKTQKIGEKIITISFESISAINLFRVMKIKIDCMVCINEGLGEGGGIYHINSDVFLGYVFPLFSDNIIHIGSLDYYSNFNRYQHIKKHYLDLPFLEIKCLNESSNEYISPKLFNRGYEGIVTKLNTKSNKSITIFSNGVEIIIKHSSIWEDINELNIGFVRFDNDRQKRLIEKFHKNVYSIFVNLKDEKGGLDINQIIKLIKQKKTKSLGFIPNECHYPTMLKRILKNKPSSLEKITFYHLNRNDYRYLKEWMILETHTKD